MKAYQRIVREKQSSTNGDGQLWTTDYIQNSCPLNHSTIRRINFNSARPIIEEHEWMGTMPLPKSIRAIFGIFFKDNLGGAVVFVQPPTQQFNKHFHRKVVQLNRGACLWWTPNGSASKLIGQSLQVLGQEGIIAVLAYCTPEAGEYGTIYQACNFWHIGQTSASKMHFLDGRWIADRSLSVKRHWAKGKDAKWLAAFKNLPSKPTLPKFKYVKLIGSRSENRVIARHYGWKPLPYPKRAAEVSEATRDGSTVEGEVQSLDAATLKDS